MALLVAWSFPGVSSTPALVKSRSASQLSLRNDVSVGGPRIGAAVSLETSQPLNGLVFSVIIF